MLYIIASPIGNLSDISNRALQVLSSTPLIIAENPGHTKKLLNHYRITASRLVQFAEHNEEVILPKLLADLEKGDAALISDAGTPGISDPGFRLVRACVEAGIAVSPIPGPNAAIAALSASGLPTDKFIFFGFLGKTEPKVAEAMQQAAEIRATAVFYESPERIRKTLGFITKSHPECKVVIVRELTKIHEEFIRGTAAEIAEALAARTSIKGEVTVLVSFK